MTDSFIFHQVNPAPTPGTHVLAIGVGTYPYLLGGNPMQQFPDNQGLGQLVSPPASALDVAQWFRDDFNNPQRPLASIALLVSEPGGDPASAATMDHVELAIEEWFGRCSTHTDNLPVFYFCGHGLGAGGLLSLLAEDFGASALAPLRGALDFNRFHAGMARCQAAQQVYFIDACRTDAKLIVAASGFAGRVPIQPDASGAWTERPVFYSTLKGLPAYGRARSHFCDGLLAAFAGTASDDADGDWRVNTNLLHRAISVHMKRRIDAGMASAQIPPADNLTTFDLHWLNGDPQVPVFVDCRPAEAAVQGNLHYRPAGNAVMQQAMAAANGTWEVVVPAGRYDFEAKFPPGTYQTAQKPDVMVSPPYRKVPLEVKP